MEPLSVFARPTIDFSVVVLPTPLRPMRHTRLRSGTVRFTPRKMREPSYETEMLERVSISVLLLLLPAKINLNHAFIVLYFVHAPFAKDVTLMQHGDFAGELADEGHIVLDDD